MPSRCFLMALLVVCSDSCQAEQASESKPNILLILSDDQAWGDYGFMGHPRIETPSIDRLARESLTYTRGYVTAPICRPSLASILTGTACHHHGVTGNDPATGDSTIRNSRSRRHQRHHALHQAIYDRLERLPNLVQLLSDAGYATLQTGKWWEADPKNFGFSHAMTHGDPKRGARHGDEGLKISRQGIDPIRRFLDEVREGEKRPFFIWHAPFLPHAPHTPPRDLLEKYRPLAPSEPVAKYWAMCEWFDQTCDELLAEIDERELRDSTVVVYVTDNGWIQDPERAGRYAPRSKQTPFEGGIRTPIMVRQPDAISSRIDQETLVSAIDIAPTLLMMAGQTPPPTMSGIDLRDQAALKARDAVYGAAFPHDIIDVHSPAKGVKSRYVISGQWKLIAYGDPAARRELYDLASDPHEERDLAREKTEIVARLTDQLESWWEK
ncbi:Arylsulfatase [Planctomycetes bacterium MalM25]|nr:Arylsulfatase [Planctomycetes bacterium MalM25]